MLIRHLPELDLRGPILSMEEFLPDLESALGQAGHEVCLWRRRAFSGVSSSVWPPPDPFGTVLLRHPRGKEELAMSLNAGASTLEPEGSLLLYGANDEGIRGGPAAMEELFEDVETVATGGRCRVLRGRLRAGPAEIRGALADWRRTVPMDHPELPETWVTYPGIFAHGRLDEGTRLLLEALPTLPPDARILDYGCGSGVVGFVARERGTGINVELLDVDTVALEAARENVPGARFHLHDGLPSREMDPFDAILSNPPFHQGKAESPELIEAMIGGAARLLKKKGILVFVAQRRLRLEEALRREYRRVESLAEDATFRVWMALGPRERSPGRGRLASGAGEPGQGRT